ncbi:MAG: outer membrane protein assembly factor BamD [Bryobacteraceae bacterium]
MLFKTPGYFFVLLATAGLLSSCAFHRKKYENPIAKNTLQPDKVLFDRAIGDIEHGRYEVARITLNTLINTYDASEYLAKAKLAIADSWYREGGAHGLAQAEAEYKDFILFYPTMEEAAESQWRVCQIHYKQMEKADRDNTQAQRAEDECRQLLVQFPNSKYLPQAQQMLRNTQEVLGDKEFLTGTFYHTKGSFPAAANRLAFVADQYPLYSGADEALWELGDSYTKMGDRFEDKAAVAYSRIVKDYPLSDRADEAKERLATLKRPIPPADPAAIARMKYDMEHREKAGMLSQALGVFKRGPDTHTAAKMGAPAMTSLRPPVPVSVPATAAGTGAGTSSDVSLQQVTNSTELDTRPDARQNPPAAGNVPGADPAASGTATNAAAAASSATALATDNRPLPTNRQPLKQKKKSKKQIKDEEKQAAAAKQTDAKPSETKQ